MQSELINKVTITPTNETARQRAIYAEKAYCIASPSDQEKRYAWKNKDQARWFTCLRSPYKLARY